MMCFKHLTLIRLTLIWLTLIWLTLIWLPGCAPSEIKQTGQQTDQQNVLCPNCNGTGRCKPPELWIKYHPETNHESTCPMCGGGGVLIQESPGILRSRPTSSELSSIPNGSVLFWNGGLLVRPITKRTGSTITHAAIIMDGYVYEAVPPRVHKVAWNEYVEEMKVKGEKRSDFTWFVMEPNKPYSNAEQVLMRKHLESQLGRPYRLKGWWKGREVRGIFCSQLVGNAIETTGRIKSSNFRESPGSLLKKIEPLYTKVKH